MTDLPALSNRVIAGTTLLLLLVFAMTLLGVGAMNSLDDAVQAELAMLQERTGLAQDITRDVITVIRDGDGVRSTTDTAAALRAVEINADVLLKATKVDGVYDADPMKDPAASRYDTLSYHDVLRDQLKVLDAAAVSLCMENGLPIVVFDLNTPDNITRVARGDRVGTLIAAEPGGVTG